MAAGDRLRDRIKQVRMALAVPLRASVSRDVFAALVAKEAERQEEPYAGSTVKRWEEGAEPGFRAIKAIVALAKKHGIDYVTLEWLADPLIGSPAKSATKRRAKATQPGLWKLTEQAPPKRKRGGGST